MLHLNILYAWCYNYDAAFLKFGLHSKALYMYIAVVLIWRNNCALSTYIYSQGGFARCYEVTDMKTNQGYACKVVAKARIAKPHQRKKVVKIS